MPQSLTADQLTKTCDTSQFDFETTADIAYERGIIGQPRGIAAMEFGLSVDSDGFNIYLIGPSGVDRTRSITEYLNKQAQSGEVPLDWVYVHDFQREHAPRAIELPPGNGAAFRDDMAALVEVLSREIPMALDEKEFQDAVEQLTDDYNQRRNGLFEALNAEARNQSFTIIRTPQGLTMAPLTPAQRVMEPEEYNNLPDEVRDALEKQRLVLEDKLEDVLRQARQMDREFKKAQETLEREATAYVVDQHMADIQESYHDHEEVMLYLGQVREDMLENVDIFKPNHDEQPQGPQMFPSVSTAPASVLSDPFHRYKVNLFIDNGATQGAPVIVEDNPTYSRLVGRIEAEMRMGALVPDFSMIRPGALHRANGGYLVIRVNDLLQQPGAWEGLKRALHTSEIRVEESALRTGIGVVIPQTIDPEPIPLDVKIVIMGNIRTYYLLYALDPDFADLFKVKADFAPFMDRSPEAELEYARFIASRCTENDLPHFDKSGVGAVIEYGSRLADDQEHLSTLFSELSDLILEAAFWARKVEAEVVNDEHVKKAIDAGRYRDNLYEEINRQQITRERILIDTEGEVVGQANGLSVLQLGNYRFGQPNRITAQAFVGEDGVVNIEREAEMSGPSHSKGVLILSGYLGGKYAQTFPLSLTASLTFEQSYSGVDGDSASSTELYALLSALSGFPIKQCWAVTGSVNQRGQIQPVGGVTEKIEGFFDVCQARGLSGEQGVIIPHSNISSLMLKDAVRDAVREGQFTIQAIKTIDEGIELLMGQPAGQMNPDGSYPEGSVHHAVQARLAAYAEAIRARK
ncbi:MAG: AAA family ATPase [Chloroflexi bacterium]|nr:AAA family ATPase [Chloroflexota bacterium]